MDDSLKLNISSLYSEYKDPPDQKTTISNKPDSEEIKFIKKILYITTSDDCITNKTFITISIQCLEYFKELISSGNSSEHNTNNKEPTKEEETHVQILSLINNEIEFLKSHKYSPFEINQRILLQNFNKLIYSYINKLDKFNDFDYFPFSNTSLVNLLSNNNKAEISRWPFNHPYNPLIFAYIINLKFILPFEKTSNSTKEYYLFKIRILLWSLGLINALTYKKGKLSLLYKAQQYFTYEIINIFINNIDEDKNLNLDNIKNIFTLPPARNATIAQLNNNSLAKRLNCLLYGYLVESCYCLDNECDINKNSIKDLIKSCKYRKEFGGNKEIPQSYTLCNYQKNFSDNDLKELYTSSKQWFDNIVLCEFYNFKNKWLQDYEPYGIKLTQIDLIYLLDLDVDPASLNRYLNGKSKKVSPQFITEISKKTGIPKTFLTNIENETSNGFKFFYFVYKILTVISAKDVLSLQEKFAKHFKIWSKNPTPLKNKDLESTPKKSNIATMFNKTDMHIIKTVLKVLEDRPELQEIQMYKKTADKIEFLLKETSPLP